MDQVKHCVLCGAIIQEGIICISCLEFGNERDIDLINGEWKDMNKVIHNPLFIIERRINSIRARKILISISFWFPIRFLFWKRQPDKHVGNGCFERDFIERVIKIWIKWVVRTVDQY